MPIVSPTEMPGDVQPPDASVLPTGTAESVVREVNGVRIHAVAAGDGADPLVVLLHGFPECWYSWHRHVDRFVEAGYRVVVPDQRGYNLSAKPDGVRSYRITELSADVVGLIEAEGRDGAHVVGHDWGAAVAWDIALRHPHAVDRLGIVNVPHPTVFRRTITSDLRQLRRSWYVFFFQLPWLPEWFSARDGFRAWTSALRGQAAPGTFTDEDLERYRAAWAQDGATSAMINWYRAAIRHGVAPPTERVTAPTVVIWGERDEALVPEMAPDSVEFCSNGRLERFPEASHWVHHEHPEAVGDILVDHLE